MLINSGKEMSEQKKTSKNLSGFGFQKSEGLKGTWRALDKAKISKNKRFEERFYLQLAKIPLFGAEERGRVRRRRRDRGGVMKYICSKSQRERDSVSCFLGRALGAERTWLADSGFPNSTQKWCWLEGVTQSGGEGHVRADQ